MNWRRSLTLIMFAAMGCFMWVNAQDTLMIPAPGSPAPVGEGSGHMVFADVNRDGRLDLVTQHLQGRFVTVNLGDGAGLSRAMGLAANSTLGRYRIERKLGAGAMGEVFLASDPHIDRQLAIKTVLLGGPGGLEDEERRVRLMREAKAAGKLVHPHVVTLFDAGDADGVFYLAFEYVNGPDLAVRQRMEPPLTLGEVLRIGRQAAEGLDAAGTLRRPVERRALACLERFGASLRSLPRGHVRVVGTNALRKARNSRDFGRSFATIFKDVGFDFYKIDPALFAPAEVWVSHLDSGRTWHGGAGDMALLRSLWLESS